ncbi:MAG: MogA/MoaB family molybdenum cofactor biosynthesis protein [Deltaproteobacteria bacterium]|jgi:molybdenum cofactor synthesis domain-containing protein|nr:MogA/MoaB family molybdenum cofactor biosynthesis protein [Deltaproteobacteria bacterium]
MTDHKYAAAVLTVSDKGSQGLREDASGAKVGELLEASIFQVVWRGVLPDEPDQVAAKLKELCDQTRVALVVTTGGTGFSPRDLTPEATLSVAERLAPGLAELMRAEGCRKTPRAMLSRGVAAIRGGTLILNVPGSPKGAKESLEAVLPILDHALEVLSGTGGDCAAGH